VFHLSCLAEIGSSEILFSCLADSWSEYLTIEARVGNWTVDWEFLLCLDKITGEGWKAIDFVCFC
jgi:hypothetical protein